MASFAERFGVELPSDPLERERLIMALRFQNKIDPREPYSPKTGSFVPPPGADWDVNSSPPRKGGWTDQPTGRAAQADWQVETDYGPDGVVPTPRPRPQAPSSIATARNQASISEAEPDEWEQLKATRRAQKAGRQVSAEPAGPHQPQIGMGEAFSRGVESGGSLGWGDEAKGLEAASGMPASPLEQAAKKWFPESLQPVARIAGRLTEGPVMPLLRAGVGAVRRLAGDQGAEKAYETTRDTNRERDKLSSEQQTAANLAGEVAGGAATPMPALRAGARLLPYAGRLAELGAGYGAIQAAGDAEGTPTIGGTVLGGTIGGLFGGALPLAGRAAHWLTAKPWNYARNVINAEKGAERAVATAARENARISRQTGVADELTPQQLRDNPEAVLMDTLGQPGRDLARSASNMDTGAHGLLQNTLRDRAEDRPQRAVEAIDRVRGTNQTAEQLKASIRQEGIDTSDPLYEFARRNGRHDLTGGIAGSQGLPRLLERSPSLRRAATEAENALQDIYAGADQPWHGVRNLEYWDQVKRRLDVQINRAVEHGDAPEIGRLTSVKNALVERLDRQVPGYADARANSEEFFGAGNAVASGQKLHGRTQDIAQHLDSIRALRPADRQLAMQGLTDRVRQQASADPNFWGKFERDAGSVRTKLQGVLPPNEFNQLQARSYLEKIMQLSHHAVSGNSSTARQIAQRGLSSTAGAGLGYSQSGDDPLAQIGAGAGGAVTAAGIGTALMAMQDRRMANLIARALTSRDTDLIDRVASYVAKDKNVMHYLRQVTNRAGGAATRKATPAATDSERTNAGI